MSESKISCPNCGQHILAGDAWAGHTINCPACQQPLAIPGPAAPTASAAGVRLSRPSAPPPLPPPAHPPMGPQSAAPPAGGAPRTSGLAITSLVLSLLGCFFVTAIAGVICGHMARKRIRNDASLSGGGLALAGLIIGYIMLALFAGWLALLALNFKEFKKGLDAGLERERARQSQNQPGGPVLTPSQPSRSFGSRQGKQFPVPAGAVAGTIKGQTFTYTHSSLNKTMSLLTISEGEDFFADRELKIFLFLKPGESMENRAWNFNATGTGMFPHVHLSWKENDAPRNEILSSGYQLELKTGAIVDGVITGSLNLKATGKTSAELKGNFTAAVE